MNKICLILVIILLYSSCESKKGDSFPDTINLYSIPQNNVSEVFDSLEVIPLEANSSSFIHFALQLIVTSNSYLVFDINNDIYVFDKNGKYISCSSRVKGKGKGEIGYINGFTYNKYSQLIEVLTPKKVLFYDIDFQYVNSVDLPVKEPTKKNPALYYHKIYDISADKHILMSKGNFLNAGTMFFFDSKSERIYNEISFQDEIIVPFSNQRNCFQEYKGKTIAFLPFLTYGLYSLDITNFKICKEFNLDFGERMLSYKDISHFPTENEKDIQARVKFLRKSKFLFPMAHAICKDKLTIYVKDGEIANWYFIEYDMKNFSSKKYRLSNVRFDKFQPVFYPDGDHLVFIVNDNDEVNACIDAFDPSRVRISRCSGDSILSPNAAILRYKLR